MLGIPCLLRHPKYHQFWTTQKGADQADTFELGTKLSFGRSFLNISLFDTDLSDFQTALFNGTAFIISAVDARSRGVEVEAALQLDDYFRIAGSATYNHARDENHELLVNAPRWSGNLNASYDCDLTADLRFKVEAGMEFRSRVLYTSEAQTLGYGTNPTVALSPSGNPYARLNARVALSDQDDHWELALIGRNLTDKKIVAYGLPAPFVTGAAVGALDLPRTIAVQVTGRF